MPEPPVSLQRRPAPATTPPARESTRSGWGLVGLALLPVACCGLPLLLTAIATIGTGAVVGGGVGVALLATAAVVLTVAVRRRRGCHLPMDPTTTPRRH